MTTDDLNPNDADPPRTQRPLPPVAGADRFEVFRRSDAAAWGISPANVRTYLKQGAWTRLHRGIYTATERYIAATRDPELMHRLLTRAAILALPLPAYAFGPTASLFGGLPLPTGCRRRSAWYATRVPTSALFIDGSRTRRLSAPSAFTVISSPRATSP